MANDGWVFTAFSRYCPDCLHDSADGPGGPVWHGTWRLPHTFLCPQHHRLLDWRCPACHTPAFSNGYRTDGRWRPTQLLPTAHRQLHPAQCRHRPATDRHTPCVHRLDRPLAPATGPTPTMLRAHQRLAAASTGPPGHAVASLGRPATPQQFFNDVRLTALAICGTWPAATGLLPDSDHLHAIASHAESLHRTREERAGHQEDGWLARSFDHPPADPLPTAALLTQVVQILDNPHGGTALAQLLAQIPSAGARYRRLKLLAPYCSPAMTSVITENVRLLRRGANGAPPLFPQPPTHQGRLDPRSIPHHLPDTWAAPLDHLDAPALLLRRDAVIRLVQMARGGTRAEAAHYLGITLGALQSATVRIRAWQKQPGNAEAYQAALHRAADIAMRDQHTNEAEGPTTPTL
ncbi:TniQ family protein [Streptomyces sp. NPDC053079]|uniref:TniQ family protein n=1 Tax=Streptomyces sp. NPDC053079 TaxID=3365697 RepID=UPI0037D29EB2